MTELFKDINSENQQDRILALMAKACYFRFNSLWNMADENFTDEGLNTLEVLLKKVTKES